MTHTPTAAEQAEFEKARAFATGLLADMHGQVSDSGHDPQIIVYAMWVAMTRILVANWEWNPKQLARDALVHATAASCLPGVH